MGDVAVRDFCKCERPVCSNCLLPTRIGPQDVVKLIAKVKEQLKSQEFLESFPRHKLERALNYTLQTFDNLKATKKALERKDPSTSLLSGFFFDIDEDYKPLLSLVQFLNLRAENPDLFERIQRYIDLLQDSSNEDENVIEPIGCSSPDKLREGEPVFPKLEYYPGRYHIQGSDVFSLSGTNT